MAMYADDSTLWDAAETCDELNKVLNKELGNASAWVKSNKLVLNIAKTKAASQYALLRPILKDKRSIGLDLHYKN